MAQQVRKQKKNIPLLSDAETRDILLWFGWGNILHYPTGPRDYLRAALKPERKEEFLSMTRPKRKAILGFVIAEHNRRIHDAPAANAEGQGESYRPRYGNT